MMRKIGMSHESEGWRLFRRTYESAATSSYEDYTRLGDPDQASRNKRRRRETDGKE
jgi:hypothetical protein